MDEDDIKTPKAGPKTSIAVAVIGVVGSIAVAWITTQAKFQKELQAKETEVTRMKTDLEATERRLTERQKELDAKVTVVDDRLKRLDAQIALGQAVIEKLGKVPKGVGGLFGGKKDPGGPNE